MAVATAAEQATPGSKAQYQGSRQAYYDKIAKFHMAPLWEVLKGLVTPEPKTKYKAAVWKFADIKRLILEAGRRHQRRGSRAPRAGPENPAMQSNVYRNKYRIPSTPQIEEQPSSSRPRSRMTGSE